MSLEMNKPQAGKDNGSEKPEKMEAEPEIHEVESYESNNLKVDKRKRQDEEDDLETFKKNLNLVNTQEF